MTLDEFCESREPSEVVAVFHDAFYRGETAYLRDGRRRFMGGCIKGVMGNAFMPGIPSEPLPACWLEPVLGTVAGDGWLLWAPQPASTAPDTSP